MIIKMNLFAARDRIGALPLLQATQGYGQSEFLFLQSRSDLDRFAPQRRMAVAHQRTMLTHSDIWNAVDRLAARAGLSASGLAQKAGLDPTTFHKSNRITT